MLSMDDIDDPIRPDLIRPNLVDVSGSTLDVLTTTELVAMKGWEHLDVILGGLSCPCGA